jgi:hypothetical protein
MSRMFRDLDGDRTVRHPKGRSDDIAPERYGALNLVETGRNASTPEATGRSPQLRMLRSLTTWG